ncbi:hypothetical protein ACJZ2D_002840 [Fusarium nematophilum]
MADSASVSGSPKTESDEEFREPRYPDLYLELARFNLEILYDYELGYLHPIHLHDTLNGRYRVIHKLGHGGSATIWLCRDTKADLSTRYVAVKVLMADIAPDECPELEFMKLAQSLGLQTSHGAICLPLDHFQIHGPNGHHICFVYPALGPRASLGSFSSSHDPDKGLRDVCCSLVQAVSLLHSHGICHGDLTPSNVLLQAHGLDGLSEDEVLQVLGTPVRNSVMMDSNTGHDELSVPQYLVYPVKWQNVPSKYIGEQPSLIDFGESFNTARPPEDLGTPGPYRSPELILETAIGLGADLWALGCTLFEIRTGRGLFKTFDDDDNEYIDAMVQVLGKLPEPWWSTTWEIRRKCYKDEADENGLAVSAAEPESKPDGEPTNSHRNFHPSVAQGARSLKDKLAPGVWYLEVSLSEEGHREIPQQEIDIFADFLGRLLQYEPEKRMSAAAALEHEWFKL